MSFVGNIILQPETIMTYPFQIKAATSVNANNGYIPYGRTITAVDIIGYDSAGDVVSLDLIDSSEFADNIIYLRLKYPGTDGRYKVEFIFTLDNGDVDEIEFSNIIAVDK